MPGGSEEWEKVRTFRVLKAPLRHLPGQIEGPGRQRCGRLNSPRSQRGRKMPPLSPIHRPWVQQVTCEGEGGRIKNQDLCVVRPRSEFRPAAPHDLEWVCCRIPHPSPPPRPGVLTLWLCPPGFSSPPDSLSPIPDFGVPHRELFVESRCFQAAANV